MEPSAEVVKPELRLYFPSSAHPAVEVAILAEDSVALEARERLAEEFERFLAPVTGSPLPAGARFSIHMSLLGREAPEGLRCLGEPAFRTRMCQVRGWGETRVCDYGSGAACVAVEAGGGRTFSVFAEEPGTLREIAQAALLSAVGEALDLRGYHRVHAVGFNFEGKPGLVLLPAGGGKSSLAALMQLDPRCEIFSDEMPLMRAGRVHPFPVRLALRPEVAADLKISIAGARLFTRRIYPAKLHISLPSSKVAESGRLRWIFCGRPARAGEEPRIRRRGGPRAWWSVVSSMVVGIGLPQMSEYMVRGPMGTGVFRLIRIALHRFLEAFRVCASARILEFRVSPQGEMNWRCLREFLETEG